MISATKITFDTRNSKFVLVCVCVCVCVWGGGGGGGSLGPHTAKWLP